MTELLSPSLHCSQQLTLCHTAAAAAAALCRVGGGREARHWPHSTPSTPSLLLLTVLLALPAAARRSAAALPRRTFERPSPRHAGEDAERCHGVLGSSSLPSDTFSPPTRSLTRLGPTPPLAALLVQLSPHCRPSLNRLAAVLCPLLSHSLALPLPLHPPLALLPVVPPRLGGKGCCCSSRGTGHRSGRRLEPSVASDRPKGRSGGCPGVRDGQRGEDSDVAGVVCGGRGVRVVLECRQAEEAVRVRCQREVLSA